MKEKQIGDKNKAPAATETNEAVSADEKIRVFERISDALLALDNNGCYTFMNQKAGAIFGQDPVRMIGKQIRTDPPEGFGKLFQDLFENALQNQTYVYQETFHPLSGWWFEVHVYPSPEGISVFLKEITGRKLAESNLQKANRLYNFISQVNQLIVRTKEQDSLFREVCEIAVGIGEFKMAWIGLLSKDTGMITPMVHAGNESGYLSHIIKINMQDAETSKGPTGSAIRKGETVICHDIETDPRMLAWRDEALQRGYRSSIAVPIRCKGEVIGAFSLYAAEKHFFDTREVALLEEATSDISFSLDIYENEKRRLDAEITLHQYIDKLSMANDRFNLITRASNDALWEWDLATDELWANEAHQHLYGFTLSDPVPEHPQWADRLHPDERENILKEQIKHLASGVSTFVTEYRFRSSTGEYRNILDRCFIVRDSTGKAVRMLGSMVDLTEIRKVQEEVNSKAIQLQMLSDNLPGTMIFQLVRENDGTMNFRYLSREVEKLTGFRTEEVLGNSQLLYNTVHPGDRKRLADAELISCQQMKLLNEEVRAIRPGGEVRWLNIRSVPRLLPDGRVIWDGVHLDITDQKLSAEKIIKEMNLSDSIINSLPGIFYLYTKERKFLRWNRNFEEVSGYSHAEIGKMDPLSFFEGNEKEILRDKINIVFEKGEGQVEAGFKLKSGDIIPYFFTGQATMYNDMICLMGVGIDISERVKAQAEIRQVTEQLRRLSAHLLAIRDEERKRIGREIHDELGQQLTAIKMDVAWIDKKTPADAEPIREKLRNMITLLDSSHLSLRKILNELRMGILEHQGLEEALRWQGNLFTDNTGIPLAISFEKPFELKEETIASCLFRVFQESLTNITRYAHAKKVTVVLRQQPGMIRMEITDDGIGFDISILNNPVSFGILGMRERVAALDGKFLLETKPGKGTAITVTIPYHE